MAAPGGPPPPAPPIPARHAAWPPGRRDRGSLTPPLPVPAAPSAAPAAARRAEQPADQGTGVHHAPPGRAASSTAGHGLYPALPAAICWSMWSWMASSRDRAIATPYGLRVTRNWLSCLVCPP